ASFGSWLTVDGRRVLTLPWIHLASRPLFDNAMPARFSLFTSLAAAVMVALWAASRPRPAWLATLLAALAVLALIPNVSLDEWANTRGVPSLFSTSLYRSCLHRDENVIALPFGPRGESLLWQAHTDFWFRLAGGYISPKVPDTFAAPAVAHLTTSDNPSELTLGAVLTLAREKS